MSGICGIVALNGKPVDPPEIGAILEVLERRGPDGTRSWINGSLAFGHTLLATTPEARSERLPFTHQPSGCMITADVRLDNRDELISALDCSDAPIPIGDGELILRAYLKWDVGCLDRLLGDFAFAIRDPREDVLFCARDLIGMRQLNFHHEPGKLFAFATEPQAILQHPDVPHRLDEGRIGDFLEHLEAYDLTSTFFAGIHRLPPAHALTLRKGNMRVWRYGALAEQPPLRLRDERAYAEAFHDIFRTAVRERLRSPEPIASMLSGGMDSGAVSAVAANLLKAAGSNALATFSAIGTDRHCPETRAIEAAMAIEHIDPTRVSFGDIEAYRADLLTLIRSSAEPFDAHMTLPIAVYLAAHRAGHKVLLDGVGGDTTLSTPNMVTWHLRRGHVLQAWREARGEEQFWEVPQPALRSLLRSAGQVAVPRALRKLRHKWVNARIKRSQGRTSLLTPEFAHRIDMLGRIRTNAADVAHPLGDSHSDRERRMLHPFVTVARERYDRVASKLAIEPRDPFLDRRVIEFCLALPSDQIQRNGWPKYILRQSTSGLLPDAVRWRKGKEHLGWEFTKAVWANAIEELSPERDAMVSRFATSASLRNVNSLVSSETQFAEALMIQYLSNWAGENA